jgi:hypothetical protein
MSDSTTLSSLDIGTLITQTDSLEALLTSIDDKIQNGGTATQSSVADTASSTTILASNANRLGATVANDSSAVLYLLLGSGTASATNYTARVVQYAYYETPFGYTGQINGVWASDPGTGGARVTEITA